CGIRRWRRRARRCSGGAERLHELVLAHGRTAVEVELLGSLVELVLGPALVGAGGAVRCGPTGLGDAGVGGLHDLVGRGLGLGLDPVLDPIGPVRDDAEVTLDVAGRGAGAVLDGRARLASIAHGPAAGAPEGAGGGLEG